MWGSHGPTTNVYIAKMTDCPCLSCCSPIRCHGPPLQSNGAPTLPKCTRKDHIFTTRSSYAHVSDLQQVCMDVLLTDLQEEIFLCFHTVYTCWTHHMQTKTPGFFLLSSFYPMYQNYEDFCFLLVCAYCICQHLVSCGHCLNLDFTDLCRFYITCWVGEKREGAGGVCLLQWLFIGRSVHPLLGTQGSQMQMHSLED